MTNEFRGACAHDCPDTCNWIVTVRDGRAESLVGDPAHPFTRGTLCAKVNRYLETRVYHPDRLLYPLKRTGPKGSGTFTRVTWEEALADIAARWQRIIGESGAEAILPYSLAGNQGLIQMASLDRRLFGLLGTTGLERNICGEVAAHGLSLVQGNGFGIDPEAIVHSRYILLWGTNTLVTNLHLWPLIRQARDRGAKVVVIDPVRTRTAEAADWHLAPRPASDGALVLGLLHVILRDGLADRDYIGRHAAGFDELKAHVAAFPPERAAALTGLATEDIERLAREYAMAQPSLVKPLIGPEHHRNGATLFAALACLPVVTGAWRHRGGGLMRSAGALQYSAFDTKALQRPDTYPPRRTVNMRDLGRDLCSLEPPIRALFVHGVNPALTVPNRNRIIEGLKREDLFTVVHELFLTETARYADYVLPATSQVEHFDVVPAWGHHYLSFNRPAIAPPGEAISNTELARRLARALGRPEPWLQDSDETLIRTALASGSPLLAGITYERLEREGSVKLNLPEDWRPFAEGDFPTPSGKARLEMIQMAPGEIRVAPDAWPLQLITGKALHDLNSSYAQSERHRRRAGRLYVEIHPHDAASRGLAEGVPVRVFNELGELDGVECRVTDRVRPGLVWMPFGGDAGGVNALTPEEPTDEGGGSGFYDCFVEVADARQRTN